MHRYNIIYIMPFPLRLIDELCQGPTVQEYRAATASPAVPPINGVAAVFAELNRGEEVTKGLRKVDKSEMTHKNPSLRAGNTVPAGPSSPAGA